MLNLKANVFYNLNNLSENLHASREIFPETPQETEATASKHPASASFLFPKLNSNSLQLLNPLMPTIHQT